jgi:hypothetical protein
MKIYFDIPPAHYRGWPGDATVTTEAFKRPGRIQGAVRIVACAQDGGWSYRLDLQPGQLIGLALRMWVAKVRLWWLVLKLTRG